MTWDSYFSDDRNCKLTPYPVVVDWAATLVHGSNVLDVGCGYGRHAKILVSMGHRVTGVDPSIVAIEKLNVFVPQASAVRDGIEHLNLSGFNAALGFGFLQYMTRASYLPAIRSIFNALTSGGRLFITARSFQDSRHHGKIPESEKGMELSFIDHEDFATLLHSAGFGVTSIQRHTMDWPEFHDDEWYLFAVKP